MLSWIQTNPSPGGLEALHVFHFQLTREPPGKGCQNGGHCVRLLESIADATPCKHSPCDNSLCCDMPSLPRPVSLGLIWASFLLREMMGEETIIKAWGNFAGISSSSSELKLRSSPVNLSHRESCLVHWKAFFPFLHTSQFRPRECF